MRETQILVVQVPPQGASGHAGLVINKRHAGLVINKLSKWSCWSCNQQTLIAGGLVINKLSSVSEGTLSCRR